MYRDKSEYSELKAIDMGYETRTEWNLNIAIICKWAEKPEVEAFVNLGTPQDVRHERSDRLEVEVGHPFVTSVGTLRNRSVRFSHHRRRERRQRLALKAMPINGL